jgi:DNA-binding winged helix-turn-helix (wHTH) protein
MGRTSVKLAAWRTNRWLAVADFVFEPFRLDESERRLTRGTQVVHLEPKVFDVLRYLLAHAGNLVEKRVLVDAVWSQAIVSDNSLTRVIHQIRAELGDDSESPAYIETVPGSGYRFIAPVTTIEEGEPKVGWQLRRRWPAALSTFALLAMAVWNLREGMLQSRGRCASHRSRRWRGKGMRGRRGDGGGSARACRHAAGSANARNGRAFVARHHDNRVLAKQLERILCELTS